MICCPTCNAHFTDNPKLIGQVVTCPKCHLKFVAEIVPTPEASTKDEETKHNGTQQQAAAEVAAQQHQAVQNDLDDIDLDDIDLDDIDEETKHNGTQQQAAAEVAEQQHQDIRIWDELLIFFGIVLAGLGVIAVFISMVMDTSVREVHNIGKLNIQVCGVVVGVGMFVGGIVLSGLVAIRRVLKDLRFELKQISKHDIS